MQAIGDVFVERMTMERVSSQVSRSIMKIDSLDLSMVKEKLCEPVEDDGKGWTMEYANAVEPWYKNFLKLHLLVKETEFLPPKMVDFMWHAHILFTRRYHHDTKQIFGSYFHHGPFSNRKMEVDMEDLKRKVEHTVAMLEQFFGHLPFDKFHWFCWNNCTNH